MKLLTLNCHSWQEKDQIKKIEYLAKVIHEESYDVIALQEVSQHRDSKISFDNIKEDNFAYLLVQELKNLGSDYNFIWDFSHYGYDVWEEGLALLSKKTIKEVESFYISKSDSVENWKSRKVIGGKVEFDGKDISFYTCHTGWWKDEEEPFAYQAKKLIEKLKENQNHTFFMGDFNNDARVKNEGYDYLIQNKFIDTYTLARKKDDGHTVVGDIAGWEGNHSYKRLDLILTSKIIKIERSSVIFDGKNKDIVSDHFGVEVVTDKY